MSEEAVKTAENGEEVEKDRGEERYWGWGSSNTWIWGVVLIAAGALLLLRNVSGFEFINFDNWWAVFILVPGVGMLARAWESYRRGGRGAGGSLFWGGFLTLLALSFFFSINIGLIWPVFLILAGIGLLFRAF